MADLNEISLLCDALSYGEVEPLLKHFVEHGLSDPTTRKLVAELARGKALRGQGKKLARRTVGERDDLLRMLVANQRGLLVHAGKDPRGAAALVAKESQSNKDPRFDGGLDRKQVTRIWKARRASLSLTVCFDYGNAGIKIVP